MIEKIIEIFKNECNYNSLNKYNSKILRNKENGIRLFK